MDVLDSGALHDKGHLMKLARRSLAVSYLLLFPFSLFAAAPLAQDYSIVFHNGDPESYVEGCGLEKLADGSLLAVVPVVPRLEWNEARRVEHSTTHILRSRDQGKTWEELSTLPYYSAVPWTREGKIYLFAFLPGHKIRNDDLQLLRSDDGGATWSTPVTLFKGHYWNCHTGMAILGHTLYWAVDDLALGKARGPRLIAGNLAGDLMDPATWRISEPVPFPGIPAELTNPRFAELPSQYLEPNVIAVNGHIRVLATVKAHRQTTSGLCALLEGEDKDDKLTLKFTQYSPMPGGQLKFCVIRDDISKMFWATANLTVSSQGDIDLWRMGETRDLLKSDQRIGGNDRRLLMLMYSLDGLNWLQAGCVAKAATIRQSFNYARPIIDGDDLAIIARSNVNGPNAHDADCATFHRVRNFRSLALDLIPEPESN